MCSSGMGWNRTYAKTPGEEEEGFAKDNRTIVLSSSLGVWAFRHLFRECSGALRRVAGEDEVAILDGPVAVVAALEHCPVGKGLPVIELRVPPAAGRGVLRRVLHHKLHAVLRRPGNE